MKKFLKVILIILIIIVVAIGGILIYVTNFLPNIEAPEDLKVEMTHENIERGKYLANEVMGCVGCHAQRDYSRFAGPIIEETKGGGGELWDHKLNFPGTLYAPNITPTVLKDWTDGEIYRAITAGVDKNGKPLFPIMPYHQYGKLPKEDIYAVIAYIRQLKPLANTYPKRKLDFPLNILVHLMPAEGSHFLKPDSTNLVKLGEYMITAASCYDCHTPMEKGRFVENMAYAGGMEFPLPTGGIVRAANLTPDKETGLGNWSEEMFVNRFKAYADPGYVPHKVAPNEFNSYMPWDYYSHLKEHDLKAIYAYLQSLKPINHKVEKFTPGS